MGSNGLRYEIAQTAYIKFILHSLKHPTSAVNGVLIGRISASNDVVEIADAVPLFHSHIPLLPQLEISLIMIEEYFSAKGLNIVGYFHANERSDDNELGGVAKNIGDHICRYFPEAAVLLLDNKKLDALKKSKDRSAIMQWLGLHQGSTLSPYLFTLILDVLTEQIQEIAPRCMLFADDIVLLGESREELNERLETWRRALETHGFRLSRSKSEYMECKFNKRRRVSNSEVKIGDHIIPQVTRFKYLGSVIQDDGEIEGDVNHRIQAGWMKWRKASGVLCDAKVPIKLKGKFYRTAVRPAILYGTECWAVKSQHENKVGVAEMRMLRWMCGKTRQDKIRNEAIRERVGVAPIVEKMVENRLRWFGHVERRPVDSVVRRVDQMERRQTIRGRGRPKKTIRELYVRDTSKNWKLVQSDGNNRFSLKEPSANLVLLDYIASEKWNDIVDFDDHLDDISKDWVNPGLFN
ncbi:ER membrane protein complex subunit 8/9-like [Glycine soja]|uniref:ER membrane protein complex subunit 8/9-like n=1 Tax=Glycine soja TaxID=3848 RepID=A0A445H010_GLYSO|nr:ER membrane protein complex subunit 8/9-like [Glycine soja]